jgi:uncharacterized protein YlxP (DUF503 family)
MVIGVCTVYLSIPMSHSLKDKRHVLKSVIARVRNDFNVSIAEVEQQDAWQTAVLGIACVSADLPYVQGLLNRVVEAVSDYRLDFEILDYTIETY